MNRRSFLNDMLKAGVACTFLPGAGRIWKPVLTPAQRLIFPGPHPASIWFEPVREYTCFDQAYMDHLKRLYERGTHFTKIGESLVDALDFSKLGPRKVDLYDLVKAVRA